MFLSSFLAVEQMRDGASPEKAAKIAIERVAEKYSEFFGAVLAVNSKGEIGAACNGMEKFPYSVGNAENNSTAVKYVTCANRFINEL